MDSRLEEPITVRMTARIWAGIDAEVDNVVSLAAEDGDEQTVGIGLAIREAGWDQVPWVNGNWPPMEQIISIRLTRAQWRFAAEETGKSIALYEGLGDDESAQLGRDALAVIEGDAAS
ncbi:hypothetical protein [Amycolatopsis pittospori]|uniref:hypothetical protein n=1 Tax=Amycolatopsis pittospori TaxID=2749434 RepID=UPI0015F039A1|nr:hypothetical protein [Amycolatopsis pittospori]